MLWLDKNFGASRSTSCFYIGRNVSLLEYNGARKSSFWEIFGGMSMSNGTKQQYKQFNIDSISDACLTLGMLITGVIVNLEKYKEYAAEAELLLESNVEEYIPAKAYDDINDKLLYRQREILKFLADHQNSSFSYINLRRLLEKKGYLSSPLSVEMTQLLNELLDVRNWTFHNPQSLMVAAKEVAEKNLPDELKGIAQVLPQLNPVIVKKVNRYELIMLVSLTIHAKRRTVQFEKNLASMKSDYQELYNGIENKLFVMTQEGLSSEVQYAERFIDSGLTDFSSDIAQISMAIQKSKYDGTDEKFGELIMRMGNEVSDKKGVE